MSDPNLHPVMQEALEPFMGSSQDHETQPTFGNMSLADRNDVMRVVALLGDNANRASIISEIRREMDLGGLSSDEVLEASRLLALAAGHTKRRV